MRADIALEAPLNDANGEWRMICGREHIDKLVYGDIVRQFRDRPEQILMVLAEMRNCIAVAVSGKLSDVFGANHEYSWERKSDGRQGRPNHYIITYCFPMTAEGLPGRDAIISKAERDVRTLVHRAYQRSRESGVSNVGEQSAEFESASSSHSGAWLDAAETMQKNRSIRPFVDADGKIEYVQIRRTFPKSEAVPALEPEVAREERAGGAEWSWPFHYPLGRLSRLLSDWRFTAKFAALFAMSLGVVGLLAFSLVAPEQPPVPYRPSQKLKDASVDVQRAQSSNRWTAATETLREADPRSPTKSAGDEYQGFFATMQRSFPSQYRRAVATLSGGATTDPPSYGPDALANALVHQLMQGNSVPMLRGSADGVTAIFGAQRDILDAMVAEANQQCAIFLLNPKEFNLSTVAAPHRAVFAKWASALAQATQEGMTNASGLDAGMEVPPLAGDEGALSKESAIGEEIDLLLGGRNESRPAGLSLGRLCKAAQGLYQKIGAVSNSDQRLRLMTGMLKSQYAR